MPGSPHRQPAISPAHQPAHTHLQACLACGVILSELAVSAATEKRVYQPTWRTISRATASSKSRLSQR